MQTALQTKFGVAAAASRVSWRPCCCSMRILETLAHGSHACAACQCLVDEGDDAAVLGVCRALAR